MNGFFTFKNPCATNFGFSCEVTLSTCLAKFCARLCLEAQIVVPGHKFVPRHKTGTNLFLLRKVRRYVVITA